MASQGQLQPLIIIILYFNCFFLATSLAILPEESSEAEDFLSTWKSWASWRRGMKVRLKQQMMNWKIESKHIHKKNKWPSQRDYNNVKILYTWIFLQRLWCLLCRKGNQGSEKKRTFLQESESAFYALKHALSRAQLNSAAARSFIE